MLNTSKKSIQFHTNYYNLIQVNTKITAKTHKKHWNTKIFRIEKY